ncbi:MAG: class I SAM-dependent methyltransferase [Myxococcota bacterium]
MSDDRLAVPPTERFTATAEGYARHRPSYPAELVDWVIATAALPAGAAVVDLGCGTGIATRLFAARGFDVLGVDPNEAMLAEARRAATDADGLGSAQASARYQRGEAIASGLADASADLVIAAQAFHWFELAPTMAELRRVLRPGGWACAFWNVRRASPFTTAYEALLKGIGDYGKTPKPGPTIAAIEAFPGVADLRAFELPASQRLDRPGLSGRARSSSYVAHGVRDEAAFEAALDDLFARFAERGAVSLTYSVTARMWRFR